MAAKTQLTKAQSVAYLAEKTELSKKQVAGFMDELQALAVKEAKKSGAFVIPGIGKVVLSNRKARMGRNPQTGEPIKIAAKRVVRIRAVKVLKDSILGVKK
jgi:DNA-binding protein HU-beta